MILKSIQSTRKRKKFFAQTHHVNQHISLKAKKEKKKKEKSLPDYPKKNVQLLLGTSFKSGRNFPTFISSI